MVHLIKPQFNLIGRIEIKPTKNLVDSRFNQLNIGWFGPTFKIFVRNKEFINSFEDHSQLVVQSRLNQPKN